MSRKNRPTVRIQTSKRQAAASVITADKRASSSVQKRTPVGSADVVADVARGVVHAPERVEVATTAKQHDLLARRRARWAAK